MARDYELGLIINPDVGDEQARAIVDRVTQTVASNDGQVVRVNAWGRRRLAYPIEHHRDGLYFFFDLILAPEAVSELERLLRVNEAVLRHLIKVRDPRVVEQQRQREAEAEAQAAAQAEAQAAAQAAGAPVEPAPAAAMPVETGVAAETAAPEEGEAPEEVEIPAESATLSSPAAAQTSTGSAQGTASQDEADEADTEAVTEAEANA
jgi:small subunit ribosomal protein S6